MFNFSSLTAPAPAPAAVGGFGFGAPAGAPSPSPSPAVGGFGGFGAPAPAPAAVGGFGAPAPAPIGFGNGGFGTPAPAAPAPAAGGFGGFGAAPAPASAAAGGFGAFGATAAPAPAGAGFGGFGAFGAFGAPAAAPAPAGFGSFGATPAAAPAPAAVPFGAFGSAAPAPGGFGSFGQTQPQSQQQQGQGQGQQGFKPPSNPVIYTSHSSASSNNNNPNANNNGNGNGNSYNNMSNQLNSSKYMSTLPTHGHGSGSGGVTALKTLNELKFASSNLGITGVNVNSNGGSGGSENENERLIEETRAYNLLNNHNHSTSSSTSAQGQGQGHSQKNAAGNNNSNSSSNFNFRDYEEHVYDFQHNTASNTVGRNSGGGGGGDKIKRVAFFKEGDGLTSPSKVSRGDAYDRGEDDGGNDHVTHTHSHTHGKDKDNNKDLYKYLENHHTQILQSVLNHTTSSSLSLAQTRIRDRIRRDWKVDKERLLGDVVGRRVGVWFSSSSSSGNNGGGGNNRSLYNGNDTPSTSASASGNGSGYNLPQHQQHQHHNPYQATTPQSNTHTRIRQSQSQSQVQSPMMYASSPYHALNSTTLHNNNSNSDSDSNNNTSLSFTSPLNPINMQNQNNENTNNKSQGQGQSRSLHTQSQASVSGSGNTNQYQYQYGARSEIVDCDSAGELGVVCKINRNVDDSSSVKSKSCHAHAHAYASDVAKLFAASIGSDSDIESSTSDISRVNLDATAVTTPYGQAFVLLGYVFDSINEGFTSSSSSSSSYSSTNNNNGGGGGYQSRVITSGVNNTAPTPTVNVNVNTDNDSSSPDNAKLCYYQTIGVLRYLGDEYKRFITDSVITDARSNNNGRNRDGRSRSIVNSASGSGWVKDIYAYVSNDRDRFEDSDGDDVWQMVYIAMRSNSYQSALEIVTVCGDGVGSGEDVMCVKAILTLLASISSSTSSGSGSGNNGGMNRNVTQNLTDLRSPLIEIYRRSKLNTSGSTSSSSSPNNAYKIMVLCLLTLIENPINITSPLITTIEDYLYLSLYYSTSGYTSPSTPTPSTVTTNCSVLVTKLKSRLVEWGLDYFNNDTWSYVFPLLMTGGYVEALDVLSSNGVTGLCESVHVGICICLDARVGRSNGGVVGRSVEALVRVYIDRLKIKGREAAAVEYIVRLESPSSSNDSNNHNEKLTYNNMPKVIHDALINLILETPNDYTNLVGILHSDGTRVSPTYGKTHAGQIDAHFNAAIVNELLAEAAGYIVESGCSSKSEACELYKLAGEYGGVLEVFNKELAKCLFIDEETLGGGNENGSESTRLRKENRDYWLNATQAFHKLHLTKGRTHVIENLELTSNLHQGQTFQILLNLSQFYNLYNSRQWYQAFGIIDALDLLPSNENDILTKVEMYTTLLDDKLKIGYGDIITCTVRCLYELYMENKSRLSSSSSSNSSAPNGVAGTNASDEMDGLRYRTRVIVTYSGLICSRSHSSNASGSGNNYNSGNYSYSSGGGYGSGRKSGGGGGITKEVCAAVGRMEGFMIDGGRR